MRTEHNNTIIHFFLTELLYIVFCFTATAISLAIYELKLLGLRC
jgi:hypothetical protein